MRTLRIGHGLSWLIMNYGLHYFRCNLSESYFTNRQDRYILIRDCPELANFFHDIVDAVSSFSFELDVTDHLHKPPDIEHPFEGKYLNL